MSFAGKLLGEKGKNALQRFSRGFDKDYGIGREDTQSSMYEQRARQGRDKEATRLESFFSTNPSVFRARELTGTADPIAMQVRKEQNMDLEKDPMVRAGQVAGTVAGDLTQDRGRGLWWLLNAAQATGEVINEEILKRANKFGAQRGGKDIYGTSPVMVKDQSGNDVPLKVDDADYILDNKLGAYNREGKLAPTRGVIFKDGDVYKRNVAPGYIQALAIPTGIAINTGLGLMTPFGGAEGYKAAIPSEEDPTKTDNILGEVALKYIMGKTGNLLPYDEFKKVRPDVSRDEYNAYQQFKYDNREDWNPLDGDFSFLAGALKTTDEGIHGPEVQFLGRSLPVTTGIVPYAGALAGGALGVATGKPIKYGVGGGMAGLAAGQIVGNLLEAERRRRNAEENGIPL